MWEWLLKIFAGSASTVIDSGTGLVKTIWGDQAAKDAAVASEQHDALAQFAAEFVARQQRTWWDSLVDGINRLPRPMLVIGVHATFVWAAWDPVSFTECMRALQTAPDMLWTVWLTIVAFFFGGRIIENAPRAWKIEPKALELAKEIAVARAARRALPPSPQSTAGEIPAGPQSQIDPGAPGAALDASVLDEAWAEQPELARPIDNATVPERAVAATIWGEARNEPYEGRVAVAWVIRNRVASPGWWGNDWISVCTKRLQFTCWWDSQAPHVRTVDESDPRFVECLAIARDVITGNRTDPTGGSDHYYADNIPVPKWAGDKTPATKIGHHVFYHLGLGA